MNGVSLTGIKKEFACTGLLDAGRLLSEGLPLCERFSARRVTALSEEESSSDSLRCDRWSARRFTRFSRENSFSRAQTEVCEPGSKRADNPSQLPKKADEKKSRRVMPMVIRCTGMSISTGGLVSQLRRDSASADAKQRVRAVLEA